MVALVSTANARSVAVDSAFESVREEATGVNLWLVGLDSQGWIEFFGLPGRFVGK